VETQITNDAKTALDKTRKNGRIDQAKERAALQKLIDNLDKIRSTTHGRKAQNTAPPAPTQQERVVRTATPLVISRGSPW
jgi:hypothetical protein